MAQNVDLQEIAERLLDEAAIGDVSELPVGARDAAKDAHDAVRDVLSVAEQAKRDLAELGSKRDLVPASGLQRLRAEAGEDALKRAGEASRRFDRALETLKGELTEAALPRLEPGRELLARDEFRTAIGDATGSEAVGRMLGVVQHGSHEAAAVAFTEYARTFMVSRGVANVDDHLARFKTVAASVAPQRGKTARELVAASGLGQLGKMSAARGTALSVLRHSLGE